MNTLLKRQFTPENITELSKNEIFVFGSNLNGNHAGGAAKTALEKFRAIQGQAEGLQGQSYALPTLGKKMQKLPLSTISKHIDTLYQFAESRPDLVFWVTKIGCGIAGFDEKEIAELFKKKETPFNVFLPKEFTVIRGFKGFNKCLVCRDFQYEENTEYVHNGEVEACESGFHFCENPFDVFNYYEPHKSEFAQVEGWGDIDNSEEDKIAVSHLSVKDKLSIQSLVDKGIDFTRKKVHFFRDRASDFIQENTNNNYINSGGYNTVNSGEDNSINSGGYKSVNSGGDKSVNIGWDGSVNSGGEYSVNIGWDGSVNSGGYKSVNSGGEYSVNIGWDGSVNSGGYKSVNSGRDKSVNSGRDKSANSGGSYSVNSGGSCSVNSGGFKSINIGGFQSVNSGGNNSVNIGGTHSINRGEDYSVNSGGFNSINIGGDHSVNSGENNSIIIGGDYSVCTGKYQSEINLNGSNSFGIAGKDSKIKGKKGCAICLVAHDENYQITSVKSAIIDGKILKEDTFYKLENGEFVECN